MLRLTIVDSDGKTLTPKDIQSLAELTNLVEQARGIIRECERQADAKRPKTTTPAGKVPYS